MHSGEALSEQEIEAITGEVASFVIVDSDGMISDANLPDKWRVVGNPPKMYKATILGPDYFAKYFVPGCAIYAQALFAATKKLSELPLEVPVLGPLGIGHNTLIFPGGDFIEYKFFDDTLEKTHEAVVAIARKHKLTPLYSQSRVELFEFKGQRRLVDVLDDSDYAINNFLHPEKRYTSGHGAQ